MKSNESKNLRPSKLIAKDISESLGRLPPQAPELEEAVLGAILLEKDAINHALAASLAPEHFYFEAHATIYIACLEMFKKSLPIDIRTIIDWLRKDGKLDLISEGAYYIAELTSKVSSAANVDYHIRIVQEKFMKRELIKMGSMIHEQGYSETDIFDNLEEIQKMLFSVDIGRTAQKPVMSAFSLYTNTVKALQSKISHNGLTGIPSGFRPLDAITSGWQRSNLVIIAARPGMGKTSFTMTLAREAARNIPVAVFSLEMASQELMERLISSENKIPNDKLRSGILTALDWEVITKDQGKLSSSKLFIDDTAAISIYELRSKCMRLKHEKDIQMVLIDYLQLMRGDKGGNREQEISSISRGLKSLSKELNIPVIALSQLSRSVETRGGDKRPQLSDLRESGSIEQDSDLVLFLYRPEYYNVTVDEEGMPTQGMCEVIIAKHRSGGTGMVKVKFEKYFTKFSDYDTIQHRDPLPPQDYKSFQVERHKNTFDDKTDDTPF
jgi:replicative DNA helicase